MIRNPDCCWATDKGNRTFRREQRISNSCSNLVCRICHPGKQSKVAFMISEGREHTEESGVLLIHKKFIFPFCDAKGINFLNKAKIPVLLIPMMV
jgi:hypothetical protein